MENRSQQLGGINSIISIINIYMSERIIVEDGEQKLEKTVIIKLSKEDIVRKLDFATKQAALYTRMKVELQEQLDSFEE